MLEGARWAREWAVVGGCTSTRFFSFTMFLLSGHVTIIVFVAPKQSCEFIVVTVWLTKNVIQRLAQSSIVFCCVSGNAGPSLMGFQ